MNQHGRPSRPPAPRSACSSICGLGDLVQARLDLACAREGGRSVERSHRHTVARLSHRTTETLSPAFPWDSDPRRRSPCEPGLLELHCPQMDDAAQVAVRTNAVISDLNAQVCDRLYSSTCTMLFLYVLYLSSSAAPPPVTLVMCAATQEQCTIKIVTSACSVHHTGAPSASLLRPKTTDVVTSGSFISIVLVSHNLRRGPLHLTVLTGATAPPPSSTCCLRRQPLTSPSTVGRARLVSVKSQTPGYGAHTGGGAQDDPLQQRRLARLGSANRVPTTMSTSSVESRSIIATTSFNRCCPSASNVANTCAPG